MSISTEERRRATASLIRRNTDMIPVPSAEKNPGLPDWEALPII